MDSTGARYRDYLWDLGDVIKSRALEAKLARVGAKGSPEYEFQSGRLIAVNEVISIMQQQAAGLGIPLADLRLADIEPDRDLI
ncbi:MAG: hypothetical protein ACYC4L_12825 [Chloroflexota bacterium]